MGFMFCMFRPWIRFSIFYLTYKYTTQCRYGPITIVWLAPLQRNHFPPFPENLYHLQLIWLQFIAEVELDSMELVVFQAKIISFPDFSAVIYLYYYIYTYVKENSRNLDSQRIFSPDCPIITFFTNHILSLT